MVLGSQSLASFCTAIIISAGWARLSEIHVKHSNQPFEHSKRALTTSPLTLDV